MDEQKLEAVWLHPDFRRLVQKKTRLAWSLTAVVLAAYFAFILFLAFSPGTLALPIGASTITVGIPVAVGFIVLSFVLTAVYVCKANGDIEAIIEKLKVCQA